MMNDPLYTDSLTFLGEQAPCMENDCIIYADIPIEMDKTPDANPDVLPAALDPRVRPMFPDEPTQDFLPTDTTNIAPATESPLPPPDGGTTAPRKNLLDNISTWVKDHPGLALAAGGAGIYFLFFHKKKQRRK
jgi:hypothetical protein